MKKLLAVLLTLMLVLPNTVFADTAKLFTLSDASLSMYSDGEEQNIDLSGLKIVLGAVGEADDTLAINVLADDEVVFAAGLKADGDKVLISVDGLSNTYYVDMPEMEVNTEDLQETEFDFSGIDFNAIAENFVNAIEFGTEDDGTMTFRVPNSAIAEALDGLLPLLDQVPEGSIPAEAKEEIISKVAEMKDTDTGFELNGTLSTTDDGMSLTANFVPVTEGKADENPALVLNGTMSASEEGDMLFTFAVSTTDSESGEMAEIISGNFGNMGGVATCTITILGQYTVNFTYNAAEGTVIIGFVMGEEMFCTLSVKVGTEENGEITVCEFGDAASAINLQTLDEEQSQQFIDEISEAASGLVSFLLSAGEDAEIEEIEDAEVEEVEDAEEVVEDAEEAAEDDAA